MNEKEKYKVYSCKRGFSLIEILITVAIIALIAAAAIPFLAGRLREARVDNDKTNIVLLQSTVDMFNRNRGDYPVNPLDPDDHHLYGGDRNHELVIYGYLREIPVSPFPIDPGYLMEEGKVKSLAEGDFYHD